MVARTEFADAKARSIRRKILRFGKNTDLQSFSQSQQTLGTSNRSERGIHLINVDQIIGSLNDNKNFDDRFNPRNRISQGRWTRLYIGFISGDAIPPIEVYQIKDSYYVIDGHHRVSVARAIGQIMIEAHIIRIEGICDNVKS